MFEPRIVCFFCKWCTYAGADLAGTSRKQYPPNGVVVRVNCSGRIDPQHIIWALREGADGVLIGGCHPGDCHYQDGNHKTMRRVAFLKRMLEDMGIDPRRLHLEWISAAEGEKLVHVMGDFVEAVKEMGALHIELAGAGRGGFMATPPKPVKKTATKKAPAKKKTVAGKKPAKKKPAARKKATKKRPAKKKPAARKKATKKRPAKKKPVARKKATKKRPAKKKTVARKKATKKAPAKKKTVARKKATKKAPAKKTVARKTASKKSPAKKKTVSRKKPAKKKPTARKKPAKRTARKASAGRKKR